MRKIFCIVLMVLVSFAVVAQEENELRGLNVLFGYSGVTNEKQDVLIAGFSYSFNETWSGGLKSGVVFEQPDAPADPASVNALVGIFAGYSWDLNKITLGSDFVIGENFITEIYVGYERAMLTSAPLIIVPALSLKYAFAEVSDMSLHKISVSPGLTFVKNRCIFNPSLTIPIMMKLGDNEYFTRDSVVFPDKIGLTLIFGYQF